MDQVYSINTLFKESVAHGLVMTQGSEPFMPFLTLIKRSGRSLNVLAGNDIQQALDASTGLIQRQTEEVLMYALVWDGRVTLEGVKKDCIIVEIANSKEAKIVAQPYTGFDPASADGSHVVIQETVSRLLSSPMVGSFKAWEWNKLIELPALLFQLIAGADGEIDKKEINTFVEILKKADNTDDLFTALLISTANNFNEIYSDVSHSSYDIWHNLNAIVQIFKPHLSTNDLSKIKSDIQTFAENIAKSSGGFMGFGAKIGKEERNTLDKLKLALEV